MATQIQSLYGCKNVAKVPPVIFHIDSKCKTKLNCVNVVED